MRKCLIITLSVFMLFCIWIAFSAYVNHNQTNNDLNALITDISDKISKFEDCFSDNIDDLQKCIKSSMSSLKKNVLDSNQITFLIFLLEVIFIGIGGTVLIILKNYHDTIKRNTKKIIVPISEYFEKSASYLVNYFTEVHHMAVLINLANGSDETKLQSTRIYLRDTFRTLHKFLYKAENQKLWISKNEYSFILDTISQMKSLFDEPDWDSSEEMKEVQDLLKQSEKIIKDGDFLNRYLQIIKQISSNQD